MKIRNYWKQVLAWALCVVIAMGLLYVVHDDRKKNAEETGVRPLRRDVNN